MKVANPHFSERYKAHVEAERQYVSDCEQANPPAAGKRQPCPLSSAANMEEAFRSARSENRRNTASSA